MAACSVDEEHKSHRRHVLPLPLRLLLRLYGGHLLLLAPDFLRELGPVVVRVSLFVL